MRLSQTDKDNIRLALLDAEALVKTLKGATAWQEADEEKVRPFITNAKGYCDNVRDYLNHQKWECDIGLGDLFPNDDDLDK